MSAKLYPQVAAALAASSFSFIVGTLLGWTNPVESFVENGILGPKVSAEEFSWISSSMTIGAACTCIPIGFVVNQFGRKLTMLVIVVPLVIGWALLLWSGMLPAMYIGRFLLGVAAGTFCVSAPLYTGEIAQKEIRGTLGAFFQLMATLGILFVYVAGATMSVLVMSTVCEILPIIFFIIFLFFPESPVYLVKAEKMEKAVKSIQFLRGKDYDCNAEIAEIEDTEKKIHTHPVSLGKALSRRASKKALAIGMGLMFFQQLCGINAVIFYSTDIFEVAKTGISSKISTIIIGIVQVISTLIATMIVDRIGRRVLLLISGSVMGLSTTALGVYFFMADQDADSVQSISWLPIISLCVFICMFSIGYGPVPWLMMGELFASDIRGVAASIAATLNWILAFVVTKMFVNVREALGTGPTFWLFSIISFIGVLFVFFIVLETKGKSLNEIQESLEGEQ